MPVCRVPVHARVLTHRCHHDSVSEGQTAKLERLEQPWPRLAHPDNGSQILPNRNRQRLPTPHAMMIWEVLRRVARDALTRHGRRVFRPKRSDFSTIAGGRHRRHDPNKNVRAGSRRLCRPARSPTRLVGDKADMQNPAPVSPPTKSGQFPLPSEQSAESDEIQAENAAENNFGLAAGRRPGYALPERRPGRATSR
jgi:hypothetical protein